MKERVFRFKQFSVAHSRSAMKVGVDGVLIGAWGNVGGRRVLDVGCGCGMIAIMAAQRNPQAEVIGVEIEHEAAEEARTNAESSPWSERLRIIEGDVMRLDGDLQFDSIISNPPFFDSGVADITSTRELARHSGLLSPLSLIDVACRLLSPDGSLSMIFPADGLERVVKYAGECGLRPARICLVRGHASAPLKRAMVELRRSGEECERLELVLELSAGVPTDANRALCRDFYLKF